MHVISHSVDNAVNPPIRQPLSPPGTAAHCLPAIAKITKESHEARSKPARDCDRPTSARVRSDSVFINIEVLDLGTDFRLWSHLVQSIGRERKEESNALLLRARHVVLSSSLKKLPVKDGSSNQKALRAKWK